MYNIFSNICFFLSFTSLISYFIPSINFKYTAIGKLPIPVAGSNHLIFLFFHISFGNLSNISFIKIIGVNTSPFSFFSTSLGFKQSFINSNNSFGLSISDCNDILN